MRQPERVLKQLTAGLSAQLCEEQSRAYIRNEESLINRVYKGPFDMLCGLFVVVCTRIYLKNSPS